MKLQNFELVRAPKLSEQIAQQLTTEIKKGAINEGEKLPSEATLSDRFNVSRTVVREAIACLEFDGLIEVKRGTRAVVASPHARKVFRIDYPVTLEDPKLAQLYELRMIIEGSAVVLAAKKRKKNDLLALEGCLRNMRDISIKERGAKGVAANVQFHLLIAEASKNDYLKEFMMFLNDKLAVMMTRDQKKIHKANLVEKIHEEHYAIYKAIKNKASVKARKAMEDHIILAASRQGIKLDSL